MDLGLMLQALSLEHIAGNAAGMARGAQPVPRPIEEEIARRFVDGLGASR